MLTAIDLGLARGHWLAPHTIAWPRDSLAPGVAPADLDWTLHCSPDGGIDPDRREPLPWTTIPLGVQPGDLPAPLLDDHPHLSGSIPLSVPALPDLAELLRGQVVVTARQRNRRLADASGVQYARLLDQLYPDAVHARLGVTWHDGSPTLRVWAPTAHHVDVLVWDAGRSLDTSPQRHRMTRADDGTWAATGDPTWRDARYLYAVTVFAPSFGRLVENRVTDPYSIGLTLNSTHSLVLDIDDPALRPAVWDETPVPPLRHPVDQVVYELHVRDFSRADKTVPEDLRGTFAAFAVDSDGTRHLRRLAEAGLTSVQLLPIFDYSSVEEDPCRRTVPDAETLKAAAPDSDEQQRHVLAAAERRAYNWGYDPWHHQVPEGSLCSEAAIHAGGRVREARLMVGSLHAMGLRVVLDQVYNHTDGAGQGGTSVLGRIVPGYYHRRDEDGTVATSTCCPNVATEHVMAGKLMVDSVVHWVKHYRVDGFRFDLMGHHSRDNMLAVRAALDALTLERDGVDGRSVTLYGEGWDFGEVAGNARFVQATQGQLAGTQIATFSDRLRDAVRGGGPFDEDPRGQGFATGLAGAPNGVPANGTPEVQRDRLLGYTDLIQLGLAGNLRDYTFVSARSRRLVRGDEVPYKGILAAGYADAPDEVITYVDAHDNETLFDALTLKLPVGFPMGQRVRANTLALAVATLGQSPVMWHAGTDFLRSKSLDRNSYTSGDWFNYLDFTLTDNGFGAGLPPAGDNADKWVHMRPLLANPALKPSPDDMRLAHAMCLDLLRLRASSLLFRLADPVQVRAKVSFPVSGTWAQQDGVVVMVLDDTLGEPVDERYASIVVVFNANPWPVRQLVPPVVGQPCRLHPVQAEGADRFVRASRCDDGQFSVPGLTAAVFVRHR
ncbi:MAG TPA: pullulanase-type alpha-1,6-glucosidase [Propionibacterium sp.]|nr:pullulanase-type alpha-1,6-glucosidase [Propionibacterium sp.]